MKQYIIWLLCLQQCISEYTDYNDYYPNKIPLQNAQRFESENPSPEYEAVMDNLYEKWKSPLSNLQKRDYMPQDKPNAQNVFNGEVLDKDENYFFFSKNNGEGIRDDQKDWTNDRHRYSLRDDSQALDEAAKTNASEGKTEALPTESPTEASTGIIKKVKEKFLNIFSHKGRDKENDKGGKSDLFNWEDDLDESEFLETSNDNEFEEKKLFPRSVYEKTANATKLESKDLLSNLSNTDLQYVLSFIDCFKKSRQSYQIQPKSANSTMRTNESNSTSKPITNNRTGSISADTKEVSNQSYVKPGDKKGTQTISGSTTSSPKLTSTTTDCTASSPRTQNKTNGISDDITVDMDINQKNGTGEGTHLNERCKCFPIITTTPSLSPRPDKNKFVTKSKFLAHLHHMVDEVGKPPHKPIDLAKVQDVIDKSKRLSTVIMGDGKTTECADLRLNDLSFDLEWNRNGKSGGNDRDNSNILDFPNVNEQQSQSMAAKFLQDVNSYSYNIDDSIETPYSDNFLEQRSLLGNLGLPLKSSTKREAFSPNSLPDSEDDDYFFVDADYSPASEKRRVKGRMRGRGKKKPKPKYRVGSNSKGPSEDADVNIVPLEVDDFYQDKGNNFNSFDELKDIQFRVNDDDGEAISKFIGNLNSPPEMFSFDVDKYLNSAKLAMEPQVPEFENQSPERRPFYEFMQAPEIENERLTLIDAPAPVYLEDDKAVVKKRGRNYAGKRDLLRQYIKGVSSAINYNLPEAGNYKAAEEKPQRSPNLDTDISYRTNNLIDVFSPNLDAMNSIKSANDHYDSLDKFYLLNDGSTQFDSAKQDVIPDKKYSPQNSEFDLNLNNNFRDSAIGAYRCGDKLKPNAGYDEKNGEDIEKENPQNERGDYDQY